MMVEFFIILTGVLFVFLQSCNPNFAPWFYNLLLAAALSAVTTFLFFNYQVVAVQ